MVAMTDRPDDPLRGRIAFDGTRTPLKTALFVILCAAWLLPGLFAHDPWKVDEATSFGAVIEMLRSGDWVNFRVAGEPLIGKPPLYLWVAALAAKAFGGWLAVQDAARLASVVFVAGTLVFLTLACLELIGERALRVGVMLFIGTLGLLMRAHEMVPDLAGLMGIAMVLYGLGLALRRPWWGGVVAGLGAGATFLGGGFQPLLMVVMLAGLLPLVAPLWRTRRYLATLALMLACAAPLVAGWLLALRHESAGLLASWLEQALSTRWNGPSASEDASAEMLYFVRIVPWYAWPAWPLAAWSLWRSRRTLLARRDLMLPLAAFVAFLIVDSAFAEPHDIAALPLLLPLAMLGVAELDTLPRGAAAALDWFGMTTFFLFAALIWVGFVAALTGKPAFAAAMIAREVPGFEYHFNFLAVALAALLTLVWLVVVARSLRSTRRALVNWTAGITMVWMLAMTLGIPIIDQARSYRALASKVVEHLPAGFRCVARHNVGDAQRALLDYFVNLRMIRDDFPAAQHCGALLVQTRPPRVPMVGPQWSEVWRGSRPGDRNELFILYARRLATAPAS